MAMFLIILASCLLAQLTHASKLQEQGASLAGKTSTRRTQSQPNADWTTSETTTGIFEPPTSARLNAAELISSVNETQQVDIGSSSAAPEVASTVATTSGSTESSSTTSTATSLTSAEGANRSADTTGPSQSSMSMSLDGMLMNSRPRAETSGSSKSRGHKKAARQGEQAKSSRRIPPSGPQFVSPAAKGQRTKAKQQSKQQVKPSNQQQKLLSNSSSLKSASKEIAQDNRNAAIPGNDGNSLIDGIDLMRNLLGTQQPQSSMMNNPDDMVMSVMSSADGKERRLVMIARDTLDTLQRFAADEAKRQQQEQQQQVAINFMQPFTTTTDSSSTRDQTSSQMKMNDGWMTVGTSSENPSSVIGSIETISATKAANRSGSSEASVELGVNRDSLREVPVSALVDRTSTTQSSTETTNPTTTTSTTTTIDAIRSTSAIDTVQRLTNGQQRMEAINQQQQSASAEQPTTSNRSTGFRGETGSRKSAANRQGDTRVGAPAGKTNGATKRKNNKLSINKQTNVGGGTRETNSKQVAVGTTSNSKSTGNTKQRSNSLAAVEGGGSTATPTASSRAGEPPVAINHASFASSSPAKSGNSRATTVPNKLTGANQQRTTTGGSTQARLVAPSVDFDTDNSSARKPTSASSSGLSRGGDGDASFGREEPLGELESLRATIPGEPLLDYPIYSAPPKSSFDCQSQSCPGGYYADLDSQCQAFHICQNDGRFDTFLCPNGTIFSQQHFVCVWWWQADCQQSPSFFKLNDNIYCNSMVLPTSSSTKVQTQLSGAVASEGGMPNMNELGSSLTAAPMVTDIMQASRASSQDSNIESLVNSPLINRMLTMEADKSKQFDSASTTSATLTANSDSDLQQQRLELPSSQQ